MAAFKEKSRDEAMGRKHTGLCSCLRGLAAQMTDSFDPDYRIKFLGEIGRAAKLDLQDQRMFKKRDLITAHRDKTQQLRTMQSKLSSIQRLLFVLKDDFDTTQSCCDLCLPGQLSDVVQATINSYQHKHGDGPPEEESFLDQIANFMQLSEAYNFVKPDTLPPQLRKEFKGQSNSHIVSRLIELDHQLMQTQESLSRDEAKMELLRTTFEKCHSDFFCIRYRKLKAVIIEVTRDVTTDASQWTKMQQSAGEENSAILNTPDVLYGTN